MMGYPIFYKFVNFMKIFSWNCRGAGSSQFVRVMKDLAKLHKPDIIVVMETRCGGPKAEKIIKKIGFDDFVKVDAIGFSGGIWVLWRNPIQVFVSVIDDQFIHMKVAHDCEVWWLTAVYANPMEIKKADMRQKVKSIADDMNEPWLVCGDFNDIMSISEKKGGAGVDRRRMRLFCNWLDDCKLLDLGSSGPAFTWRGPKYGCYARVFERLDRAVCSSSWRVKFPEAYVKVLARIKSDHHPLLLYTGLKGSDTRKSMFRFEAAWLTHPNFRSFMNITWKDNVDWESQKSNFTNACKIWNCDVFGDIFARKRRLLNRLNGIQKQTNKEANPFVRRLEAKLLLEYNETLIQEEILWFQKSRSRWLVYGDRNTRYFHTSTIVKRRRNKITSLCTEEGNWISDDEALKSLAVNFYSNLYTEEVEDRPDITTNSMFPILTQNENRKLCRDITSGEIDDAIRQMGPYKSPGMDGLPPVWFQNFWDLVAPNMYSLCKSVFQDGNRLRPINETLVVLIPKVEQPEKISQFWPISLCNVSYKLFSKVIVNRLKALLVKLISPNQASFVPGRQIRDNIVVAQEIFFHMRRRKGKKGQMAIKIDLEKAYDRLSWKFIRSTLISTGMDGKMVDLILSCVSSTSLSIAWNGGKTDSFSPSRGIRQGDPLSPYLFVLCMDRLSHIIQDEVDQGQWKAVSISKNGPKISHLMFADDLLLFAEASDKQMLIVQDCLKRFGEASGQKVSEPKSQICFSRNVPNCTRRYIASVGKFKLVSGLGKYLGMPLYEGRMNKASFKFICDKVERRLAGWKAESLSMAGRITLAKSVIAASPVYAMQSTKLPVSICDFVEKRCRNFVWDEANGSRSMHYIN